MARTGKLTPELLGIISRLVVSPAPYVAKITDGQLDRKTYVALNEALEAIGGKWNRGKAGHLFADDPTDTIEALLLTGEYKTKFAGDFFQTPPELARRMVAWAVRAGDLVLEPSAGHGRIANEILKAAGRLNCYEADLERAKRLVDVLGRQYVVCGDFLSVIPDTAHLYDAVVMNPPFSKGQEARHILHAMKFLRPGGKLAAVASAGVTFRETAPYKELRAAINRGGDIEDLPPGTFKSEGTAVNTVLITWTKP